MPTLYIVATPIGNLKDITLRALETLKEVDFILCEDTRQTLKLLNHYQIKKPLISYHQHSKIAKVDYIIALLKRGKKLAQVTDSGTPGISDPGSRLIEEVQKALSGLKVIPIPGASALTAALSVSGYPLKEFTFLGFLPVKKGRRKIFEQISKSQYPVIFYESPYRIVKTLSEIGAVLGGEREIAVFRELTKKFETVYKGPIKIVLEEIKSDIIKGEFVVLIKNY